MAATVAAATAACRASVARLQVQHRPKGALLPVSRRLRSITRMASSSGDSEAGVPPSLTLGEAYTTLGLAEGSSYDEVLDAKNQLLARHSSDFERRMQIEAAYDLIFASQLRARLAGDLPVASNVRFADVQKSRRRDSRGASGAAGAAQKAQQLLSSGLGSGVVIARPKPRAVTTAAAVFGTLAAWTLAQGLLEPSPQAAAADVPGVQLALATAATVYLLREEKRVGLGKAAGLALSGLVVGTFVGAAFQSWLRVDIIPLGSLSSPGILVGEFAIAGLAAVCLFLA